MSTNRTTYFFQDLTLTANYANNHFELKRAAKYLRLISDTANLSNIQYSLNGADEDVANIDGVVKPGEDLEFGGIEFSTISLRGNGMKIRVWAY